jgi:hypothetical protein
VSFGEDRGSDCLSVFSTITKDFPKKFRDVGGGRGHFRKPLDSTVFEKIPYAVSAYAPPQRPRNPNRKLIDNK